MSNDSSGTYSWARQAGGLVSRQMTMVDDHEGDGVGCTDLNIRQGAPLFDRLLQCMM